MKADFTALWAESPVTLRREPTNTELAGGFPCGDLDLQLFNELFYRLSQVYREVGYAITASGQSPNANNGTQLWEAIRGAIRVAIPSTALVHAGPDTSSTANVITIPVVTPAVEALSDYQVYEVIPAVSITGATTLKIGALPALPIQRRDGGPLVAGDGPAGWPFLAIKLGGAFRCVGLTPAEVPSTGVWHTGTDTAGSADRLTAIITPTVLGYLRGHQYRILAAHDCIGATVANFGGLGDRQVVRGDGTPLRAGDYLAGQVVDLADDGARLQLVGVLTANQPASNIVAFTVTPTNGLWQPPTGVTKIKRARLWGAGSGGGGSTGAVSAGTGGSGPGYAEATNLVIPAGGMLAITLGTPGAGGVNGDGTQGGTCSVGISGQAAWLTATAGAAGRWGNNTISSVASSGVGQGSGPGLNVPGGIGSLGINYGGAPGSGIGGPAPFGGGTPTPNVSIGGNDGLFPGGSGNGGCGGSNGGAGALPLLILEF